MLKEHYTKLHLASTLDVNDLVPGYETLESTEVTTLNELIKTKESIIAYKQYELNMTMRVGWH